MCTINFRLLFESEIALFLNEVWSRSAFDEELARNPDNSTLAFSTELLNYIIAFATQGKSGHDNIFDS